MNATDVSALFTPFDLGPMTLQNRIVMAPLTRARALGNRPNALMAEHYGQRSTAGLVITEGASPSPDGLGYARIPGLFTDDHEAGWQPIARALHDGGAHVFVQLMHAGRVAHVDNLAGGEVLAPSAVALEDKLIFVDGRGEVPPTPPRAMSEPEIERISGDFVEAATRARRAGLDGIELHAASGYLFEQFLSPHTNHRTDAWGGTIEKRARFLLATARRTADVIGPERVGVRLSPFGALNGMPPYDEVEATYEYLARELGRLGIGYLHILDHSSMGAPPVPYPFKLQMRKWFGGATILCGGYDAARAAEDISSDACDLVAFGRPYISNPDLPHRIRLGAPLVTPDMTTAYTPGAEGYTDYPHLESSTPPA